MAETYDVIVVGGGHNGLVAASYLSKAGLRVLVLERRHIVGGPCAALEFFPGYRAAYANSPGSLEPKIVRDMELDQFGLEFIKPDPYVTHLFPGGRRFVAWRERQRTLDELRQFSEHDAHAYYDMQEFLHTFARRLRVSLFEPPPSLAEIAARLETPEDEETFAKIMFGSAKEFLDERLESDEVKAVMAILSVLHNLAGPRTPGTLLMLLMRPLSLASRAMEPGYDPRSLPLRGSTGIPRGGMGAIAKAMEQSLLASGVTLRTNAQVVKILADSHRVTGVVLSTGAEIAAPVVVSNLNPKTTFLGLIDPHCLPSVFRERIERLSMGGSQFKLGLALAELPRFAAAGDSEENAKYARCQFRIAPSMDYMERAWDDAKYGRWSRGPMMWGLTPSAVDPTLAPNGRHVMSVNIYHAPYHLADNDWRIERERFGAHCIEMLCEYFPNLKDTIVDCRFWSPRDIEDELGMVEANITHGDMLPGRMFSMRPLAGWSDYRTPVRGLYLCGAGTWPGGFVSGIPGHNAAQQVLRDLKEGLDAVYARMLREHRPGL